MYKQTNKNAVQIGKNCVVQPAAPSIECFLQDNYRPPLFSWQKFFLRTSNFIILNVKKTYTQRSLLMKINLIFYCFNNHIFFLLLISWREIVERLVCKFVFTTLGLFEDTKSFICHCFCTLILNISPVKKVNDSLLSL